MLGDCLPIRFEFLFYDSLHWKLSNSVKVKRISVTSICLPAHFGGFFFFFQKLKISRLKLGLFSWSNWISELADPPVFWGKEVNSAVFVGSATCMVLMASTSGAAVPALRGILWLCENFLGNQKWLPLKSPSWWSAFGTKRKNHKKGWTSVFFEALSHTLALWSRVSFLPILYSPEDFKGT